MASQQKTHRPIEEVEAERPAFPADSEWKFSKTPNPQWKRGTGASDTEWKNHKKVSFDPYAEGRTLVDNYKTLISGVVPRPVGFVSTVSKDGKRNLAPYSFFNAVNTEPPMFVVGTSQGQGVPKDTAQNILDTGELTINIISDWFVEASNYTAIDAPAGVDEWELSGLTPAESEKVKPPHVAESAFSIEAKLVHSHEWKAKADPSRTTGYLFIVEAVNFHAREDVINKELNTLDIAKLKPVARLGGVTYARVAEGYEIPRPEYAVLEAPEKLD